MICIDVRILNNHEILDHSIARIKALDKKVEHDLVDLFPQSLVSIKLRHLNFHHYSPELFKNKLNAL